MNTGHCLTPKNLQIVIIVAMTVLDVMIQYESKVSEMQMGVVNARLQSTAAAIALAASASIFLVLGFYAVRQQVSRWWPSLPIPVIALAGRRYQTVRESRHRMSRLKAYYERGVQRLQGTWVGTGATGEEFSDPDHVYAADLNIFGKGSLFELVCIARTSIGQRGLASYLCESPALSETLLRQQAVRELQGRADLRERVASLGRFDFLESRSQTFEDWLHSPALSYAWYLRPLTAVTSALLAGVVLAGLIGLIPWIHVAIWITPLFIFHSAVGLIFRNQVNKIHDWARFVSVETGVLREGLRLLEYEGFESEKLRQLTSNVQSASESVQKLGGLLNALNERNKELFYGPSLLLLIGTQLSMAIEQWRNENATSLSVWLQAWAEFEALNALAAYAYENPANTYPVFATGEVCFEARGLGHPLLSHNSCVVNDIELHRQTRFYVISGSNMSGKSTLLRAIGLNAVLASTGAPVRASAVRMSRLSVFASLSIVDSLLNGRSRFLAEVDRLRLTIDAAMHLKSVLFLIDEIFSGTNSRDRRIATEAVVRTLVDREAIGALSTHDLSLCEIGSSESLHGVNVHMGSKEGGEPLDFDFILKPGVTNEANALAIARMAGVPV